MIGERIGSYRVVRQIGQGGMGAVFEAVHEQLGRRSAIKVLHPHVARTPEMAARFFNEARAASIIRHPGIAEAFEFGQLPDGTVFIVMELLEGESLRQRLNRLGAVPVQDALLLGEQIAAALAAAHAQGIIHRDLKPDNVMLVADHAVAGGERAKVLDFGIAKISAEAGGGMAGGMDLKTRTGALMGTPAYMSPEQCRGAGEVGDRSDVYSLGVLLYHMLCGQPPFVAQGMGEVISMHMFVPPRPLRELAPGVPVEVARLVALMLDKDAAARPAMGQVAAELSRLSGTAPRGKGAGVVSVVPGDIPYASTLGQAAGQSAPGRRPWRRRLLLGLVPALLLVAVVTGAGYLGRGGGDPEGEAARVLLESENDMRARLWGEAGAKAGRVLGMPGLSPGTRDTAAEIKARAEQEGRLQEVYERMLAAARDKNHDQALQLFRQVPADSAYRKLGKEVYERSLPLFAAGHLKQAEAARAAGRCAEFSGEVQKVLELLPEHLQALAEKDRPCVAARGEVPATAPVPVNEEEAQRVLKAALAAYAEGNYTAPIEMCRPLARGGGASLTINLRARRLLGAAACNLHDLQLAGEAYRGLDPEGRRYLAYVCQQRGVVCSARGACKLDE